MASIAYVLLVVLITKMFQTDASPSTASSSGPS
jgi:hypothetical protein